MQDLFTVDLSITVCIHVDYSLNCGQLHLKITKTDKTVNDAYLINKLNKRLLKSLIKCLNDLSCPWTKLQELKTLTCTSRVARTCCHDTCH